MNPIKKFREMDSILKWFASIAFFGLTSAVLAVVFTVRECDAQQTFEKKCELACFPNTVYSTKYRRCECNASVIVKNIQQEQ